MAVDPTDLTRDNAGLPELDPRVEPASESMPRTSAADGRSNTAADGRSNTAADGRSNTAADGRSNTVTHRDLRGRRQEFEARKVRRLVRHVEPWSVLKASIVFFVSMWIVVVLASIIVWTVARGSGTVSNIEDFIDSNFSTEWRFDGDFLLRGVGLLGLITAVLATLAATVASVMFNLISDVVGGVWITVIEEETLRPTDAGSQPREDVR